MKQNKTVPDVLLAFVTENPGLRSSEIGARLGMTYAAVSSGLRQLRIDGVIRGELRMPSARMGGQFNVWFPVAPNEEKDDAPPVRRLVPAGQWTAHAPAVRTVFDLGAA